MTISCPPHHWLVSTPAGPTVHGVCRLCGEERTWPTTLDTEHGLLAARAAAARMTVRLNAAKRRTA